MKFGIWAPARVDIAPVAAHAERRGFDYFHLYDSQALYAETFACLALCAEHTSSIKIGHGVTNPATRIAPLMASGLATINQLAPGRTFFAIGTGYSTLKAMGFGSARLADTRTYIEQVQRLVRGETVDFTFEGRTQLVRIIHGAGSVDDTFVNLRVAFPRTSPPAGPKAWPSPARSPMA